MSADNLIAILNEVVLVTKMLEMELQVTLVATLSAARSASLVAKTVFANFMLAACGTLLSRGGVPLRTAQAAMRHSDPSLTANV